MLVDTVLYNTKILIGGRLLTAGIAINESKIVKIAKKTNLPYSSKKINLDGQITIPGLIDSHVHLRDQKLRNKETFTTGTAAAAAGGFTSVIDMPNNDPITMNAPSLKKRMQLAKKNLLVNVAFNSAFPEKLNEIKKITKLGAVGFKLYMSSRIGGINPTDDLQIYSAFKEVEKTKVPVSIHAEDLEIIEKKEKTFKKSGRNIRPSRGLLAVALRVNGSWLAQVCLGII